MLIKQSVDLATPIHHSFELVEDDRLIQRWMTGLVEMSYDNDDPKRHPVGTTFKQMIRESGRISEYAGEVLEYERPHHLAVRLVGKQFSVKVDYRFDALEVGTHLDYTADFNCTAAFARRMSELFNWLSDTVVTRQMNNLQRLAQEQQESNQARAAEG